jgi:hypothetical protein
MPRPFKPDLTVQAGVHQVIIARPHRSPRLGRPAPKRR